MPLTAEAIATRKKYLTASDAAAVLGLDPWKRAADVWYAKRYELAESEPSEAAEFGSDVEPVLVVREAKKRRWAGYVSQAWQVAINGILAATLDALRRDDAEIIEAKTSGIFNPYATSEEWGEAETDQIPRHYLVQTAVQLICTPTAGVVYVPALLGTRGPCSFVIPRDGPGMGDLLKAVEEQLLERWDRFMVRGDEIPADEPPPSLDVLKRIRREPKSVTTINTALAEEYVASKDALKEPTQRFEAAKERLIASFGEHEGGQSGLGLFVYREESAGNRVDAELLRAKHPAIAAEVSRATTRRVLRGPKP